MEPENSVYEQATFRGQEAALYTRLNTPLSQTVSIAHHQLHNLFNAISCGSFLNPL